MISHENKSLLGGLTNHVTRLALEHVRHNGVPFAGLVVDSQGTILIKFGVRVKTRGFMICMDKFNDRLLHVRGH